MKWYDKEISPKASRISLFVIIGIVSLYIFTQYRDENRKLSACSVYAVGRISRVYTLRGQTHAAYYYSINAKRVEATEGVNNFDTNESWAVDMDKLSKRRLLLQVYCDDISVHRIIWDIAVPDTLRHIPVEGWKELPFTIPN